MTCSGEKEVCPQRVSADAGESTAKSNTHSNGCNKSGVDDRGRATTEAGLATAAGVTAAGALIGAAVLWFGAPAGNATFSVRPAVDARAVGASVEGTW